MNFTVTNFLDGNTGSLITPSLQNNKKYYISILAYPGLTGGTLSFDDTEVVWIGASDEENYNLNRSLISSNNLDVVSSPLFVTDASNNEVVYPEGYGMDISPSLGLHLSGLGCVTETTIDVQTACTSFDWIDGQTYTSSNNTATHTLTNAAGCDSVVTLDLTINAIDVETTIIGIDDLSK